MTPCLSTSSMPMWHSNRQTRLHPLSSRSSVGLYPRYHALCDVIKRALDTIVFSSILEPTGLSREDVKRPDCVTIFQFSSGKCLVWDSTYKRWHPTIPARLLLTPKGGILLYIWSFRTFMKSNLWPLRPLVSMGQTFRFLNKVGRIAAECRHEPRERRCIMQRLSIRGNATGILSASPNSNFRQDMNSCIVALQSIMFLLPKYPSKTICPLYLL